MAYRCVPLEECINKRLVICSEARKKMMKVKAKLMADGKEHTDELVINKMLREFPIK